MESYHVCVSWPTAGHPKPQFCMALAHMIGRFKSDYPGWNLAISMNYEEGKLPMVRESLVEKAMAVDDQIPTSHVLFIDDDMNFPPELMHRLFEHRVPIVGVNYPTRRPPIRMTAVKNHKPISSANKRGLEKVDFCGMGAMLIDVEVFRKIPKPWFLIGTQKHPETGEFASFVTEDTWFCAQAAKAGYEIMIDHDLSQDVSHLGTIEYTHSEVQLNAELKTYLEGGSSRISPAVAA